MSAIVLHSSSSSILVSSPRDFPRFAVLQSSRLDPSAFVLRLFRRARRKSEPESLVYESRIYPRTGTMVSCLNIRSNLLRVLFAVLRSGPARIPVTPTLPPPCDL
jgi:hypothetical protein